MVIIGGYYCALLVSNGEHETRQKVQQILDYILYVCMFV